MDERLEIMTRRILVIFQPKSYFLMFENQSSSCCSKLLQYGLCCKVWHPKWSTILLFWAEGRSPYICYTVYPKSHQNNVDVALWCWSSITSMTKYCKYFFFFFWGGTIFLNVLISLWTSWAALTGHIHSIFSHKYKMYSHTHIHTSTSAPPL